MKSPIDGLLTFAFAIATVAYLMAFLVFRKRGNTWLAVTLGLWVLGLVLAPPDELQSFLRGSVTVFLVIQTYAMWERKPPVPLPRLPRAD